jgi:molybdopterin synthase sulfur carrier subunit
MSVACWRHCRARRRARASSGDSVKNLRCAVNQEMARDFDTPVKAGDEVAFFPPVTGG